MIDRTDLWLVMVVLGLGTYLIRFSFLGALGGRVLPGWLIRALRYTAVAVLPALVAPGWCGPSQPAGKSIPRGCWRRLQRFASGLSAAT